MLRQLKKKVLLSLHKAANDSPLPDLDVNEHKNHTHTYAPIRAVGQQMGPLLRGETEQALINHPRAKNEKYLKC